MADDFEQLIKQSVALETNIGDLYLCFGMAFEEDSDFWWELAMEERRHAELIRSAEQWFLETNNFPIELLLYNLAEIEETNAMLVSLIKQYKEQVPAKMEVFAIALEIEASAAEMHYQEFMHKEEDSQIVKILHKLNHADKDHYIRIQAYMQEMGIEFYQAEETAVQD